MDKDKSKFPDLKELTSMTGKLLQDIKKSIGEIFGNYKKERGTPGHTTSSHKKEESSATKPAHKTTHAPQATATHTTHATTTHAHKTPKPKIVATVAVKKEEKPKKEVKHEDHSKHKDDDK